MSDRYWGIEWSAWTFDGISCERASFEEAAPFIREHYPEIFVTEPGRFFEEKMTEAKRRFFDDCDVFVFRADGTTVGICIAHPSDWSTYYVRTFALLPEYRERRFPSEFQARLAATMSAAGVERLEAETSPANVPMNRLFLAAGWIQTAMVNSERWGTNVRYTRYLGAESQRCFRRQFISVPAYGRKPVKNP